MHVIASTNILTVLGTLSTALPLVYMTDTGATVTIVAYPTLNLAVKLVYATSTQFISEATLLTFRPAAVKVTGVDV